MQTSVAPVVAPVPALPAAAVAARPDDAVRCIVAVRTLCEFTARAGDLDLRFSPSPTAQQGIAGHQRIARRRPPPYRSEVSLAADQGGLQVRGRADGYDPLRQRIEEVKTCRGDPARLPANLRALHRAQALVYGALACRQWSMPEIEVAVVYLDLATDQETVEAERVDAVTLDAFLALQCSRFVAWADSEHRYARRRRSVLAGLDFPLPSLRTGQRRLAEAVYRAAGAGRCVLAQAPTGIGKTLGVLFPLLKALAVDRVDRIFYLTARTSGRALALDALDTFDALSRRDGRAAPLRVLELTARDKACVHPDRACHGESCPLARGFHDRLPAARTAAAAAPALRRADLARLAADHAVCPYYLAQEMVRWSDVIVGDYNHYFDASAGLHAATLAHEWRVGIVVDEAHNLIERARTMYTAALDPAAFGRLRRTAPAVLQPALAAVARAWRSVGQGLDRDYQADDDLPAALTTALQSATAAIGDWLALRDGPVDGAAAPILDFHFAALAYLRLADAFGPHALFERRREAGLTGPDDVVPCIRNIVPAAHLAPRFTAARTVVLMSATLMPPAFHADMLGLPPDTVELDIAAPFRADQLSVRVAAGLSTRYRDRDAMLDRLAGRIVAQFRARPGNYLVFTGGYEYLARVVDRVGARAPDIPLRVQQRGMTEAAQAAFVAAFSEAEPAVRFVVLGGAFAEGIDLPGERLVGACIATLGLPRPDAVNEATRVRIRDWLARRDASAGVDANSGSVARGHVAAAHDYTYLFPGLQRVVQAAGRVIRGEDDRGVVLLLDDRFLRPEVRRLLPAWWRVERD